MKIIPKNKSNTVQLSNIIPGNPFLITRGGASPQYYIRVEAVSSKVKIENGWIPTVNLSTGTLSCMSASAEVEMIRMSVVQE